VVLVGAADVASRVASATFGDSAGQVLFAPAAAIGDPSVLDSVKGTQNSASSTQAFVPTRLKVPSLGVDASVEAVSNKDDGSMQTPKNFSDVGWYQPGSKPGEAGNAVFAGHVNNALTKSGVFEHLSQVHIGDYVTVEDGSGHSLVYKVMAIDQYPWNEAPAQSIFATTGPSQLILITCDGEWLKSERTYDKRLVVTATPAYR
jgi:LPXTG-site transpeptidase (sortase) family protein